MEQHSAALCAVAERARAAGCAVAFDEPMARHTTMRVGGAADLFVTAPDAAGACAVLSAGKAAGVPVTLVGNGSDLIVGDRGIRGAVLRLAAQPPVLLPDGIHVQCGAGTTLSALCVFARDRGLAGLEFAYGIPGTLGGALFMNAGAYGGEIADVTETVQAVTFGGAALTVPAADMAFGYRHSAAQGRTGDERLLFTAATLCLTPDDPAAIAARMDDYMQRRRDKQPLEYPSAGSFFRRPAGHFAGALIEQAGLKGCRIGGAAVSGKHAGFVVNLGGATAADITALSAHVRERVLAHSGVELTPEVRFIGEF